MNWWTLVGTAQNLLMVHAGPVHQEEEAKKLSMSSLWRTGSFFMDEGFMRGRLWSFAIDKFNSWWKRGRNLILGKCSLDLITVTLLFFQVIAAADFGCHILHIEMKNQETLIK